MKSIILFAAAIPLIFFFSCKKKDNFEGSTLQQKIIGEWHFDKLHTETLINNVIFSDELDSSMRGNLNIVFSERGTGKTIQSGTEEAFSYVINEYTRDLFLRSGTDDDIMQIIEITRSVLICKDERTWMTGVNQYKTIDTWYFRK